MRVGAVQPMPTSALLDQVERRAFDFFWFECDPKNGIVKDRAGNTVSDSYDAASIASTGYMLAALPIGVEKGWISKAKGEERAKITLEFFLDRAENEHGWYYHFLEMKSGKRKWKSEVSSIDSALLLAGAITAGEYFRGEVKAQADKFYQRFDFQWMLNQMSGKTEKMLSMGWIPEHGFIPARWNGYSELMFLYILAMGTPNNPLPADSWTAWRRKVISYKGMDTLTGGALFMHQMSHCFIDFKDKRDFLGYNYWVSSKNATLINRQFCIDHSKEFKTFSKEVWGLTACDSPDGYRAFSAPSTYIEDYSGTVAPSAPITSILFSKDLAMEAMQGIYTKYGYEIWGRYGFANSFNADKNWYDKDVIGIDLGMMLLAIEDDKSGLIWKLFGGHPAVKLGMSKAGFHKSDNDSLLNTLR